MKTSLILGALMLLVVTSCDKSTVKPASEKTPLSSFTQQNLSSNNTVSFNNQTFIDLTQGYYEINSCPSEILQILSGIWHIDYHGTISNNHVLIDQHTNVQSYKLVSPATGIQYTGSYTSDFHYGGTLNNGQFTFTQGISTKLMTPGGQNNSISTFDVHETINANGVITAYIDNFKVGCQ